MKKWFSTPFWTDGLGLMWLVFGVFLPFAVLVLVATWITIYAVLYGVTMLLLRMVS